MRLDARHLFRRRRRRSQRPSWRSRTQWLGVSAVLLLAAVVGGPDMAERVWTGIEGSGGVPAPRVPTSIGGETFAGVVTQITDGDTFRIGDRVVRLCGVNAPERGERGYREAGAYLGRLIDGRRFRAVASGVVRSVTADRTRQAITGWLRRVL